MKKFCFFPFLLLTGLLFISITTFSQRVPPIIVIPEDSIVYSMSLYNYNPVPAKQYQRVFSPLKPIQDSALITLAAQPEDISIATAYIDKMGRPLQQVIKAASPQKKDFVTASLYDDLSGRITKEYMPYVQISGNTNDGKFKQYALYNDSIFYKTLFPSENFIYNETVYDLSPLQRVKKVMAAGNSWVGQSRGKSMVQRANTTLDSVRLWTIDIISEDDIPVTSSFYVAGSLLVNEMTDEKGVKTVSYTDELGRIILTKAQIATTPSTGPAGWLCTYNVYDETGSLRMVIPPKAVELLYTTANWSLVNNSTIVTGLCYSYYYDVRGRAIMGSIPGKGKTYMAYDMFDRIAMVQEPLLRITNQWAFVLYDGQGRKNKTGLITTTLIKDSVIAQASRSTNYPTLTGTYTVTSEIYYDDYSWIASTGAPVNSNFVTTGINSTNFYTSYNTFPEYPQEIVTSTRIRGSVTGIKKIIVGSTNYLYVVPLYDDKGRPVQIKETNYTGGTDVLTKQYSFSNRTLRSLLQHQNSGANAQTHTLLTKYSYDHAGRLDTVIKNIDNHGSKIISRISYNELGQPTTKVLGANLETQNLEYNIRGWLKAINKNFINTPNSTSAWFGETIFYDSGYTVNQFNGAIAGVKWKGGGDGIARGYEFSYDNANRLTAADFKQQNSGSTSWTKDKVDFSVSGLSYDANGNILSMRQRGLKIAAIATIDSLTYQYFTHSNRLQKVNDAITHTSPLADFKDSTWTGDDYTYDDNGNITKDYNRRMHTATSGNGAVYNYLNKPDSVAISGKATVHYRYDAAGIKLRRQVNDYTTGTLVSKTFLYINGFVYMNDTLQYVLHEEGRIRNVYKWNAQTSSFEWSFEYDYFLRDHLNNVRTVLTEEQRTDMYPPASMEDVSDPNDLSDPANYIPYYTRSNYNEDPEYRQAIENISGYPPDDYTSPNHYVTALKSANRKVGPGIMLKVMSGDKFNVRASSWYRDYQQSTANYGDIIDDLLTVLSEGVSAAGGKGSSGEVLSAGLNTSATLFLENQQNSWDNGRPGAYVNWILFDEQFNLVESSSGYEQVGDADEFKIHEFNELPIDKSGYLYVYVSNASQQDWVYFDNLQVTHIRGPLLQEQSYYPFGLEMAGISSKAADILSSQYKFNGGVELEEETNFYSTFYRQYDAQLGRFNGVDIMSEATSSYSIYNFAINNPITYNDPLGDRFGVPQVYMDAHGNKWHSPSPLQGTSHGYMLYDWASNSVYTDADGGWGFPGSASGGGGYSINLGRVDAVRSLLVSLGYRVNGLHFRNGRGGNFGAFIGYNYGESSSNEISDVLIGSYFINLSKWTTRNSLFKPNFNSGFNWNAFSKANDGVGLFTDLSEHGITYGSKLKNKFQNTSFDPKKSAPLRALKGVGFVSDAYDVGEAIVDAWNNPSFSSISTATLKTGWAVISNFTPVGRGVSLAIDVADGIGDLLDWW